jgi:hypothetical protein
MLRRLVWWIAVNVAGIGLYLHLASALWVLPGEEGLPGGPGDAFYFFLLLAPIALVYLIGNVLALILAMRGLKNGGNEIVLFVWLAVGASWICALGYDQHRSFRVIYPPDANIGQTLRCTEG